MGPNAKDAEGIQYKKRCCLYQERELSEEKILKSGLFAAKHLPCVSALNSFVENRNLSPISIDRIAPSFPLYSFCKNFGFCEKNGL